MTTAAVTLLMIMIIVVAIGLTAVIISTSDESLKRKVHKDKPWDPSRREKNRQALVELDWATIDASFKYVVIDDGKLVCWAKTVHDVTACLPRASYDALLVARPGTRIESKPPESIFYP